MKQKLNDAILIVFYFELGRKPQTPPHKYAVVSAIRWVFDYYYDEDEESSRDSAIEKVKELTGYKEKMIENALEASEDLFLFPKFRKRYIEFVKIMTS